MLLLAASLAGLLQPWPLKLIIDSVLGHHGLPQRLASLFGTLGADRESGTLLAALCLTLLGLQVLVGMLNVLQTAALVSVGLRMVFKLRCAIFDHVQRLSLSFHDTATVGDSLYRIVWSTYCVQTLFNGGLVPAATAVVTLLGIIGVMQSLDRGMTLAALIVCVPLVLLISYLDRPMNEYSERVQERESEVSTRAQETLTGIRAVQAFGQQTLESARFQREARASLRANLRLTLLQTGSQAAVQAVLATGTAALLWIGTTRVLQGRLTTGDVILLVTYVAMLYKPLETLAYTAATVQGAAAGARRVYAVLDSAPGVQDMPDACEFPEIVHGRVTLHNLSFGYGGDAAFYMTSTWTFLRVRASPSWARPGQARRRWRVCCCAFTTRPRDRSCWTGTTCAR